MKLITVKTHLFLTENSQANSHVTSNDQLGLINLIGSHLLISCPLPLYTQCFPIIFSVNVKISCKMFAVFNSGQLSSILLHNTWRSRRLVKHCLLVAVASLINTKVTSKIFPSVNCWRDQQQVQTTGRNKRKITEISTSIATDED